MKVITLSAVLTLAATAALADQIPGNNINSNGKLNVASVIPDKRQARHHEISNGFVAKRTDGPAGYIRHENQGKSGSKHNEHGLEAHNDGGSRYHNRNKNPPQGTTPTENTGNDANNDDHVGENKDSEEGSSKGGQKNGGRSKSGDHNGSSGDKKGGNGSDDGAANKSTDRNSGGAANKSKGGNNDGTADTSNDDNSGTSTDREGGNSGSPSNNNSHHAAPGTGGNGKQIGSTPGKADGTPGNVDGTPGKDGENKQVAGTPPTGGEDKKGDGTNPSVPRDFVSPLWLVQPIGSSVWAQGTTYVISWGPNPDPVYSASLNSNIPIDIRLMQGAPDNLREIAVLSSGVDASIHKFDWLIPETIPPATDYSIRLSHGSDVDTYSHLFEIVKAGDARSNKSNVGEPLLMPQMGDTPQPLNKGPAPKPALPPNPLPANPPPSASTPVVGKPAVHASGAHSESHQGANMLAFALTLFGAVYFL
ncbi:hypothetical protein FBU30_007683 [Linnemannia zychae]|nr:hypothetical protein FBU30_007683 [Linnemannia zychae]